MIFNDKITEGVEALKGRFIESLVDLEYRVYRPSERYAYGTKKRHTQKDLVKDAMNRLKEKAR